MQKLADVFGGIAVTVFLITALFADGLADKPGGFRMMFGLIAVGAIFSFSAWILERRGEVNDAKRKRQ